MKKIRILLTMLLLWLGGMNVAAQISTYYENMGEVSLDGVRYDLFKGHWVVDYTQEEFWVSYEASVSGFTSNVPEVVVIPESVTKDGTSYAVSSVRYDYARNYARWTISSDKVKVLKFEGAIGFHHGYSNEKVFNLPNLTDIYFKSTPVAILEGWTYAELFKSPDASTITVHSKDKTKAEAETLKQQAPWSGFKEIIGCSPTRLMITAGAGGKNIEVWSDNAQECSIPSTGGTQWKDINNTEYLQFRIPNKYFKKIIVNCDDVTATLPSSTSTDPAYEGYTFYTWSTFNDFNAVEVVFDGYTTALDTIQFADQNVKAICVANWDKDGNGELSTNEAAEVTSLLVDGTSVFMNNTTITSFDELQYFTGLIGIEDWAFYYCRSLQSVALPPNITSINYFSFYGCSSLTDIILPKNVTYIGSGAFKYCKALKNLALPEKLETISSQSFYGSAIRSMFIPSNVSSIGTYAFSECQSLASIVVADDNVNYATPDNGNVLIDKKNKKAITALRNPKIPEGTTTICEGAFYNDSIKSVVFPSSITEINKSAFNWCPNLSSIISKIETPFDISDCYIHCSDNCVLTVPYGKKEQYKMAGWTEDVFKGGIVEDKSQYDTNGDGSVSITDLMKLVDVIFGK